jgi:hypothetical protein
VSPKGVKYPAFNVAAAKAWKASYLYVRMSCPEPVTRSTVWSSSGRKSTMCSSWCILSPYMAEICSGIPT